MLSNTESIYCVCLVGLSWFNMWSSHCEQPRIQFIKRAAKWRIVSSLRPLQVNIISILQGNILQRDETPGFGGGKGSQGWLIPIVLRLRIREMRGKKGLVASPPSSHHNNAWIYLVFPTKCPPPQYISSHTDKTQQRMNIFGVPTKCQSPQYISTYQVSTQRRITSTYVWLPANHITVPNQNISTDLNFSNIATLILKLGGETYSAICEHWIWSSTRIGKA